MVSDSPEHLGCFASLHLCHFALNPVDLGPGGFLLNREIFKQCKVAIHVSLEWSFLSFMHSPLETLVPMYRCNGREKRRFSACHPLNSLRVGLLVASPPWKALTSRSHVPCQCISWLEWHHQLPRLVHTHIPGALSQAAK